MQLNKNTAFATLQNVKKIVEHVTVILVVSGNLLSFPRHYQFLQFRYNTVNL